MIYTPPQNIATRDFSSPSVFLAGTIDMGVSVDWQQEVSKTFNDHKFNIFNPRRASWDSSWEQSIEAPEFYQQVSWELNALERADYVLMHFEKDSKSPISLLELGLFAKSNKIVVNCPDGFYRKGNVDVVCQYFNIPLFEEVLPLEATNHIISINYKK